MATLQELSDQFDIMYDNVMSNSAPALDEYEKSVFLTKAQNMFVKTAYKQFEQSEYVREMLRDLVTGSTIVTTKTGVNIVPESQFFDTPDNLIYIIFEQVELSSSDTCLNNKTVNVIPIRHDEFNERYQDPFNKPDESVAWRIDYGTSGVDKVVELIPVSTATISKYKVRYIKLPQGIILEDISPLTINEISSATPPEVPDIYHDEILEIGVALAQKQYLINNQQN